MSDVRQVGALPIKLLDDGTPAILLITSRERGRWIIPKGWPEEGYSRAQSALIEAWEEAGVRGDLSEEVFGQFRYLKADETPPREIEARTEEAVDTFLRAFTRQPQRAPQARERGEARRL